MSEFLSRTFYSNTISQWAIAFAIVIGAVIVGKIAYWITNKIVKRIMAKTKMKLDDFVGASKLKGSPLYNEIRIMRDVLDRTRPLESIVVTRQGGSEAGASTQKAGANVPPSPLCWCSNRHLLSRPGSRFPTAHGPSISS